MTIWRPSIAAGTTGQQSTSGRVATIIPPECWERWRGRPWASFGELGEMAQRLAAAALEPLGPSAVVDVRADRARRPALRAARDALDLPRRQPERLAELADRAARAVGREGGDERRVLAPVALVDARDQLLAHVAREVEVDVRQRGDLLVEEAPEEELVGDRVDVREAGQVADDRGDRRAAPAAGRQQRARRCRRRGPRPRPRARARACRGAAGRSPTARAARSARSSSSSRAGASSRSRWPGG